MGICFGGTGLGSLGSLGKMGIMGKVGNMPLTPLTPLISVLCSLPAGIARPSYTFALSSFICIFTTVMKHLFRRIFDAVKRWLAGLSFRTGVIILTSCIVFYILSFAQMLLPISPAAKGILWFVLFGMAKTTQYMGLAIVGVEGWRRIKSYFKRDKSAQKD